MFGQERVLHFHERLGHRNELRPVVCERVIHNDHIARDVRHLVDRVLHALPARAEVLALLGCGLKVLKIALVLWVVQLGHCGDWPQILVHGHTGHDRAERVHELAGLNVVTVARDLHGSRRSASVDHLAFETH